MMSMITMILSPRGKGEKKISGGRMEGDTASVIE